MKEDLRVQKTKAALFHAFYDLLSEKSFEDITVNELCERATIRRATFYKHYRDKQDFLVSIVKRFRDNFDKIFWKRGKPASTAEYFVQYCETLINYLDTQSSTVDHILTGQMRGPFLNIMIEQNYIDTYARLVEAEESGANLPVSVEAAASMITGGVSHTLVHWFDGGKKVGAAELSADIARMISAILAQ